MPGKMAELNFFANASSLVRIMPPRGPRRVLWVVVVATCACVERGGVLTRGNEARKVGHVHVQICANAIGDLAHAGKVDLAWNGRTARDDHFWLMLGRKGLHLIIVQQVVLFAHAVLNCVEPFARLVWLCAVGQVTACV